MSILALMSAIFVGVIAVGAVVAWVLYKSPLRADEYNLVYWQQHNDNWRGLL